MRYLIMQPMYKPHSINVY